MHNPAQLIADCALSARKDIFSTTGLRNAQNAQQGVWNAKELLFVQPAKMDIATMSKNLQNKQHPHINASNVSLHAPHAKPTQTIA